MLCAYMMPYDVQRDQGYAVAPILFSLQIGPPAQRQS